MKAWFGINILKYMCYVGMNVCIFLFPFWEKWDQIEKEEPLPKRKATRISSGTIAAVLAFHATRALPRVSRVTLVQCSFNGC